jgi:hypothetical protein
MKRNVLLAACLLGAAVSAQAADFVTTTAQASGANWTAAIWSNPPNTTLTAPAAGNTYQLVQNGTAFGSTAAGGGMNNTRVRNPATAGVQSFPGDSLTMNANTEIRAKAVGAILNFPGVGGNPGLILNGGALNAGDDFVFPIQGKVAVNAPSLIIPADNGAGAILQARGFNFQAALSGSGSLIICQAGITVAQEVSSSFNSYSGEWVVKAGWLKGTGIGSLGSGNITIDPLATVPITTASVLSNGPAQLELMYDIVTPGKLTLRNGGKMIMHQNCAFGAVSIEGTDLPTGRHTYAELAALFPSSFAPGGSGGMAVGRVVTVTTASNDSPGPQETSLQQAIAGVQEGDIIRFAIPGAGPHVITTPIGGYAMIQAHNVTIDGYTQPSSAPNTNPILGGNNAQIQIVLDSTGADSAVNPDNAARPFHRSTRLLFPDANPDESGNTGYGETENGILAIYGADNFTVRGLSFIGRHTPGNEADPAIYAVALVNEATNARVQGCWFGLAPGGSTQSDLKPLASAVAGFRWRIGPDAYSYGAIIGTDGDGVSDRSEFNVILGSRIGLALELPGARIAGNYFNVFPDGQHFVDVDAVLATLLAQGEDAGESIENLENGRVTDDTVIGTNGDGVSDSDERNVMAHPAYDHDIEFYSSAKRAVVAGNYFGVAIDGVTPGPVSTNFAPDLIELPGSASIRIGSNGDGVSDSLEGNLAVNSPGSRFCAAGNSVPIVSRGNVTKNCNFTGTPFGVPDSSGRTYTGYYGPYVADASAGVPPVIQRYTNNIISGIYAAPSATYPNTIIDVYVADPAAVAGTNYLPYPTVLPGRLLASFTDNGPGDLNPDPNAFTFNLSSYGLGANDYVAVSVSYSQEAGKFNAELAVSSPLSNPANQHPRLNLVRVLDPAAPPDQADMILLHWIAPDGAYLPQVNSNFDPSGWFELITPVSFGGRSFFSLPRDGAAELQVFRLISQ